MNNGQMSITSVQTVAQLVTQDSATPVTAILDGTQQKGGDFAGLLSGIQLVVKGNDLPDSGQKEQLSIKIGKHQLLLDAAAEGPPVDLLAQLNVSPLIPTASEPAAPKPGESEKVDISTDAVPSHSEPSDVAAQLAMAAYLQTGRMPEVNIPTPPPVDVQQNVASVTAQPAVITVPVVKNQTEQTAAEPTHASTQIPTVAATATAAPTTAKPEPSGRMPEANIPTPLPVDRLQNVASVTAQPAVITVPAVKNQTEQSAAGPIQAPLVITPFQQVSAKAPVPASSPLPATSGRMPEANIPKPLPVDRLQNVATATGQPAVVTAPADKSQVGQMIAEPVQTIPAEKTAAASSKPQSELPAANPTAPVPASSPVSEVEIQLSQPLPITAQVTAAPVVAGGRSAAVVQGTPVARQRLNPEQQIEKVRTGNEQGVVKEMATSLQAVASDGESTFGSETSGGDSNQGQPDSTSDNQMLAQQMRGQLSTEHQKVAALSTKAVPAEPLRQDIPEQVMQQVKERLVQHDIKPGSQQITLTLSPDSLGELKMNLNLQGQKLSVEIVTENRTVRDAIVQHSDALKESLARQNITMESFDVTTGGKGSGNQGQNQNAWRELAKQQQSWTAPRGYNTAQADLPSGLAAYQRPQGQTMLDIHY